MCHVSQSLSKNIPNNIAKYGTQYIAGLSLTDVFSQMMQWSGTNTKRIPNEFGREFVPSVASKHVVLSSKQVIH